MSNYEGTKEYELEQRIKWLEKRLCLLDERVNSLEPKEVPTKTKRQEKVEELEHIIMKMRDMDIYSSEEIAEAALEWVAGQLKQPGTVISGSREYCRGYIECLSDVRKNLGVE